MHDRAAEFLSNVLQDTGMIRIIMSTSWHSHRIYHVGVGGA